MIQGVKKKYTHLLVKKNPSIIIVWYFHFQKIIWRIWGLSLEEQINTFWLTTVSCSRLFSENGNFNTIIFDWVMSHRVCILIYETPYMKWYILLGKQNISKQLQRKYIHIIKALLCIFTRSLKCNQPHITGCPQIKRRYFRDSPLPLIMQF